MEQRGTAKGSKVHIEPDTLTDFEFIIYDDGSDPEVAGYIRELEKLDERIVLIGKEENHGLAFSLNMCIGAAKGKYIARMDADDIALPERLQVQYDFMEQTKVCVVWLQYEII